MPSLIGSGRRSCRRGLSIGPQCVAQATPVSESRREHLPVRAHGFTTWPGGELCGVWAKVITIGRVGGRGGSMDAGTVIVGAGQAALQLGVSLGERGDPGAIALLGAGAPPPYQRPPLSKEYLSGTADGTT